MPRMKTLQRMSRKGLGVSLLMILGLIALAISPVSQSEARNSATEKRGTFAANATFTLDAVSKAALPLADSVAGQSFISPTSVSADGRYVVYVSDALNVVPGQVDTNSGQDIFLFDRMTGTTQLVSQAVGMSTTTADAPSASPSISADGQYIAFASGATNLVTGQTDTNLSGDVFVFDRVAGTTQLVSRVAGTTTTTGDRGSDSPMISADGNFIAFRSLYTNLVTGQSDGNFDYDVFVFNRVAGTNQLVSRNASSATTTGNFNSEAPVISANGQYIAFNSQSTNLVTGQSDTNFGIDVFVFDRVAGTNQLVSRNASSATTTGDGSSDAPVISADGNFIAFRSSSSNLVTGQTDTNFGFDIFVFDRAGGTNQLVSRAAGTTTTAGDAGSDTPVVSSTGQFIAFKSDSTNLVTGQTDTNFSSDVFVFDRTGGTTTLVSRVGSSSTATGDGLSDAPSISSDGNFIAFSSTATNLVTGVTDANATNDVFVFNRTGGTSQLVSRDSGSSTTTANNFSLSPVISSDGNFIAFSSSATNLVAGSPDLSNFDIFEFNRGAGTSVLVSFHAAGSPNVTATDDSTLTTVNAVSDDGRYVVFTSTATNLVVGQIDTNFAEDIFVHDRVAGTTQLVSRAAGTTTTAANFFSALPVISADGNYIAYQSRATNLVTGQTDTNNGTDIFLFDRVAGTTRLISGNGNSTTMTGSSLSSNPEISSNGQFVVFQSFSTNLVTGQTDTNFNSDVFVFDRVAGTNQLVSREVGMTTMTASDASGVPVISGNGQYIAFHSTATNLVTGQTDSNFGNDVFVFDRVGGTMQLVSGAGGSSTTTGNAQSEFPVISTDGGFIAYRSLGTDIMAGLTDTNSTFDLFAFNRTGGTTQLVTRTASSATTTANGFSFGPGITATGGHIVFQSTATDVVTGQVDTNSNTDVFVFDRAGGTNQLVSRTAGSATTAGDGVSDSPVISDGGQFIAFRSEATDLVTGQTDTNTMGDVFVFDRVMPEMTLLSGANGSMTTTGNGASSTPAMNTTGQFIGFNSLATNLITNDFNANSDVFLARFGAIISATISGGGTICGSGSATVTATITGGTPPYTVTLTNGGGTQTGASPLTFPVSPGTTTTYMFQSGMDSTAEPITGSGSAVVTVSTAGTATAGPDQSVCDTSPTVTLAGAVGGSATTGTWSGGAGTFAPNATTLNATYTPTAGEISAGLVTLTLTSSGPGGACSVDTDTVKIAYLNCSELSQLMVADTSNNRVQRFDGTTWSVGGVGTIGSGNGQFRMPEAVAFNGMGRIYVADTGNNRIQWSTDSGVTWANFATVGSANTQVRAPQGLELDSAGNLYVSDTGNGRVMRFNGGVPGSGVVIASNGAGGGQVGSPRGLVIDGSFRLFVTDQSNSKIIRILNANTTTNSASGTVLATSGTALNKVQNPQGIAIDPTGNLFIADTGNSRILRWINANPNNSSTFALTGTQMGQVNQPEGVTVKFFSSGSFAGSTLLVVADTGNNRIQGRFLPTGGWSLIGSPNNIGSGIGQFRAPSKAQ